MFKFELGSKVKLALSGEAGQVIGRSQWSNSCNQYSVRYLAANGRQTQEWIEEDALVDGEAVF